MYTPATEVVQPESTVCEKNAYVLPSNREGKRAINNKKRWSEKERGKRGKGEEREENSWSDMTLRGRPVKGTDRRISFKIHEIRDFK